MKATDFVAALDLPTNIRLNQRVPKKLLVENGAPTAADKHRINEGIEEIIWVAALKPSNIGVSEFRDEVREYLEIALLNVTLRPGAKVSRVAELIHRAVPYPVLLVTAQEERLTLSLVHKRWSQGERDRTVLDGELIFADLGDALDAGLARSFQDAMSLTHQPQATIYALYQGWMDTVLALQVASITGGFTIPGSPERAEVWRNALQESVSLEKAITALCAAAAKEKQIPRQVVLNLELKQLKTKLAVAREKL